MTSIADIKERSELATVGPWIATTPYPYHWQVERPSPRGAGVDVVANYLCEADAEFIAHARDDIAILLGVIDDLTIELSEARMPTCEHGYYAARCLADWNCEHAKPYDNDAWINNRGASSQVAPPISAPVPVQTQEEK